MALLLFAGYPGASQNVTGQLLRPRSLACAYYIIRCVQLGLVLYLEWLRDYIH